jgi:hypothetical protein
MGRTYCSQTTCINRDCARHQINAPASVEIISIADLNDGLCFTSKEAFVTENTKSNRERLRAAICRSNQRTAYYCNDVCRALCGNDGSCVYCAIIADAIEEEFK